MVEKTVMVSDCMSRKLVCFDINDDIAHVVSVLLEHRISGAPVLNAEQRVIGFISEKDCIKEMLNTAFYCDLTATAADVMTQAVQSVAPDLPIAQLAEQLTNSHLKVLPVVDAGKLVGIINRSDVLKSLFEASVRCHHQSHHQSHQPGSNHQSGSSHSAHPGDKKVIA